MDIPGQHCGKAYYGLNARNELVCPTCDYNPLQQNESPSRATAVAPALDTQQPATAVASQTAGGKSYQNSLNRKIGKEAEVTTHIVLLSHYMTVTAKPTYS